ncbi:tetratricopeptide repeat protein, partial [Gemmatimonadota bacterium]
NRLTEVERFRVIGMYHMQVTEDWEASLAAYETLLEFVPDDISVLNNLAYLRWCSRDNATGVEYAQRALELDSSRSTSYGNVASGLFITGNLAQAETILERSVARFPGNPSLLILRAEFGTALGEYDAAEEALQRLAEAQRGNLFWVTRTSEGLAQLAVLRGQFGDAEGHWRDALIATERRDLPGEYLTLASRQALADALVRREPAEGVRRMEEALERHPLETVDALDRPYGNLVLLYARADQLPRARGLLADYSESGAAGQNRQSRAQYRWASGTLALAEGRSQEAIDEFRWSDDGPCVICALPWLARAYDQTGNREAALDLYERYVTTPWLGRLPLDHTQLPGAYLRLGELHDGRGNQAKAIEYYTRFVELWADAEPELQPQVEAARSALTRLRGGSGNR